MRVSFKKRKDQARRRSVSWGDDYAQKKVLPANLCDFQFLQSNLNLRNDKNIDDVYNIMDKIGEGTYGTVKAGVHITTGQRRAIKHIYKGYTTKKEEEALATEMKILQMISHTNILALVEYFETERRVYIISDIYEGGELFDEIIRRKDFDEIAASQVITQLISCISYLGTKKIIHRDLKPENILLTKNKDLSAIKLIDFGHAIEFDPDVDKPLEKLVGTPFYIAPEVLNHCYDKRIDLWSVGVICYILLCGNPPFGGNDNDQIFEKIKNGNYNMERKPWPTISTVAKDFVRSILVVDVEQRKSLKELQTHPFLGYSTYKGAPSRRSNAFSRLTRSSKKKALAKQEKSTRRKENMAVRNLRMLKSKQVFAQVIQSYVITQCLPKEVREDLASVFRTWDTNNDGVLSREELIEGVSKTAPKMAEIFDINHWFDVMDLDKNGYIEYHEFLVMATDAKIMSRKNLIAVFEFLDKDSSGFLEMDELKLALKDLDEVDRAVQDILDEADTNKDGKISLEEFLDMLLIK